jgi:hypothetical protein
MDLFNVLLEVWERHRSFPGFFNINDFSITKTHIIKFESIHKWRKLEQDEEFISDEERAFYRAEMMLRAQ